MCAWSEQGYGQVTRCPADQQCAEDRSGSQIERRAISRRQTHRLVPTPAEAGDTHQRPKRGRPTAATCCRCRHRNGYAGSRAVPLDCQRPPQRVHVQRPRNVQHHRTCWPLTNIPAARHSGAWPAGRRGMTTWNRRSLDSDITDLLRPRLVRMRARVIQQPHETVLQIGHHVRRYRVRSCSQRSV